MPPKRKQRNQAGGASKRLKQSGSSQFPSSALNPAHGDEDDDEWEDIATVECDETDNQHHRPTPTAVWCMDCGDASAAACVDVHACVDLRTARTEAEGRLLAVQTTLRKLSALEEKQGVKLTATAQLRGEGDEDAGSIAVALAVPSLTSQERAAVLGLLNGLEASPEESYLSAGVKSALRRAPFVGLRARLPDRGVGVTLKAGTILIRGDNPTDQDGADNGAGGKADEGEPAEGAWDNDEIRIYYDRPVQPSQARGAKILGYITSNLKLIGVAKPGGLYHSPGWGERYDEGMSVTLERVKFV